MADTTPAQPAPSAPEPGTTIFDAIGGAAAVEAVVDLFYDRVLGDPALAGYFEGIDVARLKRHQRLFVGQALGSAEPYPGRTMEVAHSGLGVTGEAFDLVVAHLAAALAEAGVDEPTIGTIAGALLPLKPDIVTA
ncbi:group I truncated hemoglobin [Streptomyces sp. NBC_01198]|uniref:group I truncated hemoglobin n=1 Tax=Streptomyces sp. NBC_01198 TaxID=2903769 RepID=UPI002E1085AC|nr:group 1 truncated hemoglobin [Streptomyces sp. NBC_01198]